jgi:hypothetical protein
MNYDGDTSARFDHADGTNVVDFGTLSGDCRGAVACTQSYTDAANRRVLVEADVRLNSRISFWPRVGRIAGRRCFPRTRAKCYDAYGTMAHEAGHTMGMDEFPNRYQTMYSGKRYVSDDRDYRTLGRADVRALRRLYPQP